MSILIKGMEMPIRCYTCPCADLEYYDCNLMPGTRIEQHKRLDNCPLVPVPPHGRLIDADDFERDLQFEWEQNEISNGEWVNLREYLRDAPTIIPAEEGE